MRVKSAHRRGNAFVYCVIVMVALMALVSLAVDLGHVQVVKTELARATDAAARNAARYISSGLSAAQTAAIDAADDNIVDGSAFSITSSAIQIGNWNSSTKTFTSSGSPSNAVKVTTTKSVGLWFGKIFGASTSTARATSIAYGTSTGVGGFIGLDDITTKNNTFVASYNSSTTTNPSHSSYNSNGGLASNGDVDPKNNCDLYGTLTLGPSGTNSGVVVHPSSSVVTRSTAIPTPSDPTWSPTGNPGSVPQNYTVSSNTVLAGGTYWFTSLTINANLSFSGAATVYVNGNVDLNGDLTAYNSVPSNLKIYQLGTGRSFGDSGSNNMDIIAVISAPGSDFSAKNNMKFRGACTFETINCKNNADFYYDEAIGSAAGGTTVTMVK